MQLLTQARQRAAGAQLRRGHRGLRRGARGSTRRTRRRGRAGPPPSRRARSRPRPRRPAGKTFVSGRTKAVSAETRAASAGADGFEGGGEVVVKAATQAAQLPGKIVFDVDPERVKAGDPYKIRIYLLNEGSAPIEVQSMVIATSINGKSVRGAGAAAEQGDRAPPARAAARAARHLEGGHHLVVDGGHGAHSAQRDLHEPGDLAVRRMRPLLALCWRAAAPRWRIPPSVDHQPVPCTVPGQPFTSARPSPTTARWRVRACTSSRRTRSSTASWTWRSAGSSSAARCPRRARAS